MKRKVIQLAKKTSVLSLPSTWISKFNIQKGDELDIEEIANDLIIKTNKDQKEKTITLDSEGINERTLKWLMSGLHKYGYDEITVLYKDQKVIEVMHDLIKNLFMGFAIVEQTEKRIVLRTISKDIDHEFDNVLRRAFLVTLSLANGTLEHLEKGNHKELIKLKDLEKINNQLTNFCERSINKKGYFKNSSFYYVINWNLEKIADEYKDIIDYIESIGGYTPSNDIISIFKDVNAIVDGYYHLFYKFDVKTLNDLSLKREEVLKKIKILKTSKENQIIIMHLATIANKCADFSTSTFILNIN